MKPVLRREDGGWRCSWEAMSAWNWTVKLAFRDWSEKLFGGHGRG